MGGFSKRGGARKQGVFFGKFQPVIAKGRWRPRSSILPTWRSGRKVSSLIVRVSCDKLAVVDASLLEEFISNHEPFQVETASGRVFDVAHPDFISFSPKRTSISIFFEEDGKERFAIVPLLTVTSVIRKR
jgi:hypothetical protein